MNDKSLLINDLDVVIGNLYPEIDRVKMKIRIEEVLDRYTFSLKSDLELEKDLYSNIDLYISAKAIEGLAKSTLDDYVVSLVTFAKFVDKSTVSISTSDIRKFLSSNKNVMMSTLNKHLSILKSFFAWLVNEEIILRNPVTRINNMKQPKRLTKALTQLELESVRAACISTRERALVETLYSTGCRVSEVSNMRRSKLNWNNGSIRVIGKGDKERVVYFTQMALYHLKEYLDERDLNDDSSDSLFATMRRPYRQMGVKSIQESIAKIGERSSIDKHIHPHMFRHTMATIAMDNGIQLGDLQQLLGHENANTTLRYAQVSEERKRSAHKRFV